MKTIDETRYVVAICDAITNEVMEEVTFVTSEERDEYERTNELQYCNNEKIFGWDYDGYQDVAITYDIDYVLPAYDLA